uniref:Uncharacterized protein n=1 Tax=Daucus carota subsp. sativus TaxID=79200 RepID=A0A164V253_DAUCS
MFCPEEIWSKYVNKLEDFLSEGNSVKAVQFVNEMVTDALRHVEDSLEFSSRIQDPGLFRFHALPRILSMASVTSCYNNVEVFRKDMRENLGVRTKLLHNTRSMADVYSFYYNISCTLQSKPSSLLLHRWNGGFNSASAKIRHLFSINIGFVSRRTLLCAVSKDAEESFKKTVEVDHLIDMLRDADEKEKDYEELASSVMSIVELIVHKTKEKIESATDILKDILRPAVDEEEEICWPPRDPDVLIRMEKEINRRELEGQLDEGFLAEVSAQLRQAKEDGDKPGLEAMLQKVLQLYASRVLSKRSYAKKGSEVILPEQFLETIITAPEQEWNKLLLDGLTIGKGKVTPEELFAVINKRMERTLIRTEGGSYAQRILSEYLKGIQSRSEEIIQVLKGEKQS